MLFRSKGGKEPSQANPAAPAEGAPQPPAPVVSDIAVPTAAQVPAAEKALPPEELKRRAEIAQRATTAAGELFTLMLRSPRHRDQKLADLGRQVLPAVRTGQYALLQAQSKTHGLVAPVAAVLWANVSAEVDGRLSAKLTEPVRLGPKEWRSGDVLWIVEAIGDDRALAALVRRLRTNEWKGRRVKARVSDAKGEVRLHLIEPEGAPAGAG
jgi:hemolysin-activating ACP:hemolysin acyltransferase